jgi:hypothetical protein
VELAKRAEHVDALDRSPAMIEQAKRVAPPNVTCILADVLHEPLPDARYDAIVSISALHHTPLEEVLPRLAGALRPGGVLAAAALPRGDLPQELPAELTAVIGHRLFGAAFAILRASGHGRWYAKDPHHALMPVVLDPSLTTRQVRQQASALLPGAQVSRLVFWRYFLLWQKPVSTLRPPARVFPQALAGHGGHQLRGLRQRRASSRPSGLRCHRPRACRHGYGVPKNAKEPNAMTARQQFARLLPLVLLIVLAMTGLRGAVASPRWDGPLRGDGVAVGLILEVVLGTLLAVTLSRDRAARSASDALAAGSAGPDDDRPGVPAALRFVLRWALGGGMTAVAILLIVNLHLHIFTHPGLQARSAQPPPRIRRLPGSKAGIPSSSHIPLDPILYGLLIAVLVAAVVISIWWAARLRQPAAPARIPGDLAEDSAGLRDAVESGRAALAGLDDARAAIIACYLAMEHSLAERGTARAAADTPDELLARAVATGIARGPAARRLTVLFYEARFSSHPLGSDQREAASGALDELAAELRDHAEAPA